jgi:hypothetical protein
MINEGKVNQMPAQAGKLTDAQIHVLASYVWGLSNKAHRQVTRTRTTFTVTSSPGGTEPFIPIVALAQAAAEVPPPPAEADETMVSLYEATEEDLSPQRHRAVRQLAVGVRLADPAGVLRPALA